MASIFLLNDNKIVSRLLQLSAEKHGYYLEEKMDVAPSRDHYDIVLINSDAYSPLLVEEIKEKITFNQLGYIGVKNEEVPPEFDIHLDKPFLPSDFITLVEESTLLQPPPAEEMPTEKKVLSEEVDFDEESLSLEVETPQEEGTPDIDDLLAEPSGEEEVLSEELDALEELESIDEFDLEELETEDESSVGSAGLTEATDAEEEGLKDLEQTEDALKELDALDEELDNVDLSLDSSAVMSTGVADQFVETLPQTQEQEQKEEELSPLDNLQSGEDIEHESDYIEEEINIDALSEEFDTLNEEEVRNALLPESEVEAPGETVDQAQTALQRPPKEEIVQEEVISEAEETMVESTDVEQWIRDAVAKAITPEMIKEALQDMEITIKLDFQKKEA